jgi:hypothetical protein
MPYVGKVKKKKNKLVIYSNKKIFLKKRKINILTFKIKKI